MRWLSPCLVALSLATACVGPHDVPWSMRTWNGRVEPFRVAGNVKDGDSVLLGGTRLVAHLTPGHTRGATTWTTTVDEDGSRLAVVFYPSGNVPVAARLVNNPDYPQVASDFA